MHRVLLCITLSLDLFHGNGQANQESKDQSKTPLIQEFTNISIYICFVARISQHKVDPTCKLCGKCGWNLKI